MSDFSAVLRRCVKRGFDCRSFVDAGANHGEVSQQFQQLFPAAQGYMIEPQPNLAATLLQLSSSQLHYLPYAVGDKDGTEVTLRYSHQDSYRGGSLRVRRESRGEQYYDQSAVVQCRTLDGLLAAGEITPPQLLKLDVEGNELHVLTGAQRTLQTVELICLETMLFDSWVYHPPFAVVVEALADMGYVVYDFGSFGRRPYDDALAIVDVIFAKEKSPLRAYHDWG